MTIRALDIPNETSELARWLEDQLAGDDLGTLVAELLAVHPVGEKDSTTLQGLLGSNLSEVLIRGLTLLSESQLRGLIRHPHLLLELQEQTLINGGDYWETKPASPQITQMVQRQRDFLANKSAVASSKTPEKPRTKNRVALVWWAVSAAALVLIGFGIQELALKPPVREFAWNNQLAYEPADHQQFLNRLATLATEWFSKPAQDEKQLAAKIRDFRRGCDKLIANADRIPANDRPWVLDRCRDWSKKLDTTLAALESGKPMNEIQQTTDEMIRTMIDRLRERARLRPEAGI